MLLVIETDDFTDLAFAKRYLARMQKESNDYAAESPEDYSEGYGPLALGTEHMGVAAKVVGILHPRNSHNPKSWYVIDPIEREEVKK